MSLVFNVVSCALGGIVVKLMVFQHYAGSYVELILVYFNDDYIYNVLYIYSRYFRPVCHVRIVILFPRSLVLFALLEGWSGGANDLFLSFFH
jgi:hypothetical protein